MTVDQPELAAKYGSPTTTETNLLQEPSDFSLVLGGPVYQLFRGPISPGITYNSCIAGCSLSRCSLGCHC